MEDTEFLTKFIVESDAIEGITADPKQVAVQIRKNYQKGHVGALLLLSSTARKKECLTHEIIEKVQELITAEQDSKPGGPILPLEYIGKYRSVGVQVGGRICPPPAEVRRLMEDWLSDVKRFVYTYSPLLLKDLLHRVADLHFDYEFIHPFADGNGRSGRAIVLYLMLCRKLKPFVFTASDRFETYYPAFKDHGAMRKYFKSKFEVKS